MHPIDQPIVPDTPPADVPGAMVITTKNAADTVKDLAERVLLTAVTAFITFFVTSDGLNFDLTESAATSAVVAGITVLTTFIRAATPQSFSNPLVDVMVRAGWTFLQVGSGLLVAESFAWGDFNAWQGVGSTALAAAITVVKSYLAERLVSNTLTPGSVFKASADQFARA